jgi:PLP dependent protein
VSVRAEIAANLATVHAAIERACQRAQRRVEEVTLVCVTKTVDDVAIRAAHEAGARDFGENYGQELRDKAAALADLPDLRWHFIGALQRNKVRYVAGQTRLIHSVGDAPLVAEIDRRAASGDRIQEVLVQLNLAGEETKSGVAEEELGALLDAFAPCQHCRCVGLMTMPPFFDDPERARPLFSRLRALRDAAVPRPNVELRQLSMGMSGDFEVAIEEGATLIRVGTAVFGKRG